MSNGNKNPRSGGGGKGQQQRRRRSGGGGGRSPQQVIRGPVMTSLGESTYEAVFDHGNEGYGVWFDGIVREDPMYRQFWKGSGTRPIFVKIEEDRITITKDAPARSEFRMPATAAASAGIDGNGIEAEGGNDIKGVVADEAGTETVYTPEEAARLFAAEAAAGTGAPPADVDADGDAEGTVEAPVEADAPGTTRRRVSTRRAANTADDDDAGDDAPAPRRAPRRRAAAASSDEPETEAPGASDNDS